MARNSHDLLKHYKKAIEKTARERYGMVKEGETNLSSVIEWFVDCGQVDVSDQRYGGLGCKFR